MSEHSHLQSSSSSYPPSPSNTSSSNNNENTISTTSSTSSKTPQKFTPTIAICFTINMIMGTGFLTLPWGFNSAGWMLSTITLVLVGVTADVSKNYVLEVMARADFLHSFDKRDGEGRMLSGRDSDDGGDGGDDGSDEWVQTPGLQTDSYGTNVQSPLITKIITNNGNGNGNANANANSNMANTALHSSEIETETAQKFYLKNTPARTIVVRHRKFEIIQLCATFLGPAGENAYLLSLCLYMYGTLWAYSSVFANALSYALPFSSLFDLPVNWGIDDYVLYVLLFACMVIPLTCMELKEQIEVQIFFSLCRLLMVVVVVTSVFFAYNADTPQFGLQTCAEGTAAVNFRGLHKILPLAVFANVFHHSIPGLSEPVGDKLELGYIFGMTFTFALLAYSTLGIVVSYYFGSLIDQSANLNWRDYHANTGHLDGENWINKEWWVNAVSFYVLCFPAFDVLSAFPLNGITLGNTIMCKYYSGNGKRSGNSATINMQVKSKRTTILFRLIGCLPPVLGSCLIRELGQITDWTGITGFIIAFTFPALLQYHSRLEMKRRGMPVQTFYSGWASIEAITGCVGGFGVFLVAFVLVCLVFEMW